ncbi:Nucleic acid-binding OB-fold [Arabidopsis suecica]|uniref:Nucleic acid-binding OB-fold n=1 Tax=Arabidopsis suecica TaxID=45249 RepID=A0A8T1ZUQ1_ARASU|nr:Nucleic acid-binding OB-fold [Arabidopsis suecica]
MDEHVDYLSPIKLCWFIEVKVLNKWRERSVDGHRSLHMVLADKRGSMIEAKIGSELISKYDSEFKDGDWIGVHHFQLEIVTDDKRTTEHTYRIVFLPDTILNPIPDKDALVYSLFEVPFRDVIGDGLRRMYLINLIGYVVDSDPNNRSRDNAMTGFRLKDARNYILSCVALEDLAEHFHDEWRRVRRPRVVCVLRWWGMYKVSGRIVVKFVGRCSRLDLNPNVPEVDEFREMSSGQSTAEPRSSRTGV